MSDTPSPAPAPESAPKPKLTLAPKAPAAPAPASQAPVAPPAEAAIPPVSSPVLQAGISPSNSTPPAIAAAAKVGSTRPGLKLQGTPHPANAPTAPAFKSPMPAVVDDSPSPVVLVLSLLAAAAAITFAVLLYLKNQ